MVYRLRYVFVYLLLLVLFSIIIYRMVDLTIIDRPFLLKQGKARSIRNVVIPAYRGMIKDRNNVPMAVSSQVYAIWANPKNANLSKTELSQLASALQLSSREISKKVNEAKTRSFVYLKRAVDPKTALKIKEKNYPGIYLQSEFKRFYPDGEIAAHVLGITNIDDKGQEGLELAFDNWLSGKPGKKKVVKDRLGRVIAEVGEIHSPKAGRDLRLSIDRRLQYIAYDELKKTVKFFNATSGSVVILSANNGEVLAMANVPSFNPNIRPTYEDGRYRNRAVTDSFEPGSVMKAFSIASGLESGGFLPETIIDTAPGKLHIDGNIVKDEHNLGKITVKQILKRSSNVGVTKITLAQPAEQLLGLLQKVGFGQSTYSGFPGESDGTLYFHKNWQPFTLATLGFGYGLSVTTLQLAKGYSVFASGGLLYPSSFLKMPEKPDGKRVLSKKIAGDMLKLLEAVVEEDGTGRRARVFGYRIAGKTGTARIANESGYQKDKHIATFVGIAPVSHPKLIVAVVINNPKKHSYYSTRVAAPLFSRIMSQSLQVLGVMPDKLEQETKVTQLN